jgi:hypothetical protein
MIKFEAPLPSPQTTSFFPNPLLNDTKGANLKVDIRRAMNGERYTYVKTTERFRFSFRFRLNRMKALELRAFIYSYSASLIRITFENGEVWALNFMNNPFEFNSSGRAEPAPGHEENTITLELEGVQLA